MVPATVKRFRRVWRCGAADDGLPGADAAAAAAGCFGVFEVGSKRPNGAATEGAVTGAFGMAGAACAGTEKADADAAPPAAASRAARRELYCTWSAGASGTRGLAIGELAIGGVTTDGADAARIERRDGSSTFPGV